MGAIHSNENLVFKYPFFFCYFERLSNEISRGFVEYSRFYVRPHDRSFWSKSSARLCNVTSMGKFIEETPSEYIKVDFANKFIGGGVLGNGCVQEEIFFLEHPELIASRLFMEVQDPGDCIVFKGPEQYSAHTGYGWETRFNGRVTDKTPRTYSGDIQKVVLAIDAVDYKRNSFSQFKEVEILREINKAYSGFLSVAREGRKIATGNWGCGVFKGNVHLKALMQVMAASQVGCDELLYCTCDDAFRAKLMEVVEKLRDRGCTVGMLYNYILECTRRMPGISDSDDVRILDMILVVLGQQC